MKRFLVFFFTLLFVISTVSGCGTPDAASRKGDKMSIVCTIFPQYDWVRQILGSQAEQAELTLLLTKQADLHSYQPTVEDILKISSCDLFIYVGGESDEWVKGALKEAANQDMITINLLETLGTAAREEEILEGMEEEKEEQGEEAHEEAAYDEHVWLSLNNAEIFCSAIAKALSSLDQDHQEEYQSNLTAYGEKLNSLDEEYHKAVAEASTKTLLFGDRFPFRYLTDDYGIAYHAAFPGCSAETEASFETIAFLAGKMDQLGLHKVMVTESADQSIARTIISNTEKKNQQILVLDSLQAVARAQADGTTTYLSVMESNLQILKEALREP